MIVQVQFIRPADSAAMLGISVATLYRWAAAGRIKLIKLGPRTSAFRLSDLKALAISEDGAKEALVEDISDINQDESTTTIEVDGGEV